MTKQDLKDVTYQPEDEAYGYLITASGHRLPAGRRVAVFAPLAAEWEKAHDDVETAAHAKETPLLEEPAAEATDESPAGDGDASSGLTT